MNKQYFKSRWYFTTAINSLGLTEIFVYKIIMDQFYNGEYKTTYMYMF